MPKKARKTQFSNTLNQLIAARESLEEAQAAYLEALEAFKADAQLPLDGLVPHLPNGTSGKAKPARTTAPAERVRENHEATKEKLLSMMTPGKVYTGADLYELSKTGASEVTFSSKVRGPLFNEGKLQKVNEDGSPWKSGSPASVRWALGSGKAKARSKGNGKGSKASKAS